MSIRHALPDLGTLTTSDVIQLQGLGGNRAVCGLLHTGPVSVQRQPEEDEIQAKPAGQTVGLAGGTAPPNVRSAIRHTRGGGRPLNETVREQLSTSMGYDFCGVRVHTDAEADRLSQQLNARAFTTGKDIFFRHGTYLPGSSSGQRLIAHELRHVVQQSSGRVRSEGREMTVRPARDVFEQEADAQTPIASDSHRGAHLDAPVQRSIAYKRAPDMPASADRAGRLDEMASDNIWRVFKNQAEALGYLESGRKSGLLGEMGNHFYRLKPGTLLVVGEQHEDTAQQYAERVAEAVGTDKYLHERFSASPKEGDQKQIVEMKRGTAEQRGLGKETSHALEHILPKIMVALSEKVAQLEQQQAGAGGPGPGSRGGYDRSAIEGGYLEFVFADKGQSLREALGYTDTPARPDADDVAQWRVIRDVFVQRAKAYMARQGVTEEKVEEFHTKRGGNQNIQQETQSDEGKAAEKYREYYMYKRLVQAQGQGYLIAGIGRNHLDNLRSELESIGGIDLKTRDDYERSSDRYGLQV